MQEKENKYERMNEVLRGFRKVPTLFEEFTRDSDPEKLVKLLEIAGCLVGIGGSSEGPKEV